MKTQLHTKCKSYDFEALFKKKGYFEADEGAQTAPIVDF